RPDCVDEEKLSMIAEYAREYDVWIEYGIQSRHDRSLRMLNRGHCWTDSVRAVNMTAEKGINVGAHLMLGLPGEDRKDMISTAEAVTRLPVSGIKLHVLHVLKNTPLEEWYGRGALSLMTSGEYVRSVCDVLEHIPPEVVIMRLVPGVHGDLLRAPLWIKDKHALIDRIRGEFEKRGTRQGSHKA
ncbi:MAG: TIGR01212 family radical SAM protein, partial [Candidatus Omnitrophica bacterium]|nr:TIGR01212 family radical SAM protein [Candidatus Omnitrophota bacterium]